MEIPYETKDRATIRPSIPIPGHILEMIFSVLLMTLIHSYCCVTITILHLWKSFHLPKLNLCIHEIRTPMSGLENRTQLVQSGSPRGRIHFQYTYSIWMSYNNIDSFFTQEKKKILKMLIFPLDQKNSPHPTVYLTLGSPFNSCQQAMSNFGVFPVPENGRSLLSLHNTQKEKCKTTPYQEDRQVG